MDNIEVAYWLKNLRVEASKHMFIAYADYFATGEGVHTWFLATRAANAEEASLRFMKHFFKEDAGYNNYFFGRNLEAVRINSLDKLEPNDVRFLEGLFSTHLLNYLPFFHEDVVLNIHYNLS